MKVWIPATVFGMVAAAYGLLYLVGTSENQGASSMGLANSVGLVAVFLGLLAAGVILRRARPPA